jgi:hypothetical protein
VDRISLERKPAHSGLDGPRMGRFIIGDGLGTDKAVQADVGAYCAETLKG